MGDKRSPFQDYLYIPELHPETQMSFNEREDEAHLLKVCLVINTHLEPCQQVNVLYLHVYGSFLTLAEDC